MRTRPAALMTYLATAAAAAAAGTMLNETDMTARYQFSAPVVSGKIATFNRPDATLVLEGSSRRARLGNVWVWLSDPASCLPGTCGVSAADAAGTLDPVLCPVKRAPSGAKWIVAIDAGHGGNDTGAISPRNILEKKVTLDIARRVRKHLHDSGAIVRLTRERDKDLGLGARTAMADQWKADIFISIHLNSASSAQAEGIETYLCPAAGVSSTSGSNGNTAACPGNRFDGQNMYLAYRIHSAVLAAAGAQDRGIRRARFEVLTTAQCPAVLVECAFLSNPAEENKVISHGYRDTLAAGIADGILGYITP